MSRYPQYRKQYSSQHFAQPPVQIQMPQQQPMTNPYVDYQYYQNNQYMQPTQPQAAHLQAQQSQPALSAIARANAARANQYQPRARPGNFRQAGKATSQRVSSLTPGVPFKYHSAASGSDHEIEPSTNVFINYIPAEFTESDLRTLCSQYGDIMTSKIMINLETGQSKCFGFVRFKTLQQAQKAIQGLNGRAVGNKHLLAKYAESHEKEEKASMTIYIKRLPMTIQVQHVTNLFSQFGEIVQIVPHVLDTIDPQYWRCFIRYTTYASASNAIAGMNNQIVVQGSRPIHVRYADESKLSAPLAFERSLTQDSLLDHSYEYQLLPSFLLQ